MNVEDISILQFFGFSEEELLDPTKREIYFLITVPRLRFKKDIITSLPESVLYSIYKNIQNTKHDTVLKILESAIKESSYYSRDKKQNALKKDKIERLKLLTISFMSIVEGIVDKEYLIKMKEINDFIKTTSKENPKTYKKALLEISKDVKKAKLRMIRDILILLLPIFEHSELLGDIILNEIVEDLTPKSLSKKNHPSAQMLQSEKECFFILKNFLKSNVFLNHVLKQIDFDITKIIPDMEKEKIRLAKRDTDQSRGIKEKITKSCIDFKYNANLFEQLIAFVYIQKGYFYTASLFKDMLSFINFSPKSFIKHCEENKFPYDKIKLQPGCSCVDSETQTSICDNPGIYDPLHFYNESCPKKCSSQ